MVAAFINSAEFAKIMEEKRIRVEVDSQVCELDAAECNTIEDIKGKIKLMYKIEDVELFHKENLLIDSQEYRKLLEGIETIDIKAILGKYRCNNSAEEGSEEVKESAAPQIAQSDLDRACAISNVLQEAITTELNQNENSHNMHKNKCIINAEEKETTKSEELIYNYGVNSIEKSEIIDETKNANEKKYSEEEEDIKQCASDISADLSVETVETNTLEVNHIEQNSKPINTEEKLQEKDNTDKNRDDLFLNNKIEDNSMKGLIDSENSIKQTADSTVENILEENSEFVSIRTIETNKELFVKKNSLININGKMYYLKKKKGKRITTSTLSQTVTRLLPRLSSLTTYLFFAIFLTFYMNLVFLIILLVILTLFALEKIRLKIEFRRNDRFKNMLKQILCFISSLWLNPGHNMTVYERTNE
ncbi:hypothetical protein NEPAR06_1974 [Nematocida parisii]|nr:hypothetical protein NEPAR06_1974 [Nematocida parisii]